MAFPVRTVIRPAVLAGKANGQLPAAILVATPDLHGGATVTLLAPAARAWRALRAEAAQDGHILKATSAGDSYRSLAGQESLFRARYTTARLVGRPTRQWQGRTWWQKPNTAVAAVPGTSNHGLGLAVDTGEERDGDAAPEPLDNATLAWLVANEEAYGFSHELQSEPWHIRYWAGDAIPAAVLAHERGDDMDVNQNAKLDGVFNLYKSVKLDTGGGNMVAFPVPLTARIDALDKKLDLILSAIAEADAKKPDPLS